MERIRLGNDIAISWAIYDLNGKAHSLVDKNINLYMSCSGLKQAVTDYTIQENVISWVFLGTEQRKVGIYKLIIVETDANGGALAIDVADAFRIVAEEVTTASGGDVSQNVSIRSVITYAGVVGVKSINVLVSPDEGGTNIVTINLLSGSYVNIPIKNGSRGESAYEVAVRDGYQGTEEEWLESLHATVDIVNNLSEGGVTKALSAEQGKVLYNGGALLGEVVETVGD